MPAQVIRNYDPKYPDPIELKAGERVRLGARDIEYPGWIWGTSARDGRSGWIPESFLRVSGEEGEALRDYRAHELSVKSGEMVHVVEEALGWALVTTNDDRQGWIPLDCLAQSVSPFDIPL